MFLRSLLDIIAPRTCLLCGCRLAVSEELLCTPCRLHMPHTDFLDDAYGNEMAKTFWGKIRHFEKAFAPIYHIPHAQSARIIYQLKYFGKPEIGIDVGEMMGRMMADKGFFDDIDCLLPVPLAKSRQRKRGYNQSELLAEGLHNISHLPIIKNAVRRTSFLSSQTDKSRLARYENVDNAFELTDNEMVTAELKGKHILVVDDVVTTGATICSLAKALQPIDGIRISVASIGYAGQWRFVKQ